MDKIKIHNSNCCVPQCSSRANKNPELSFHRFPNEKENVIILNAMNVKETANRRTEWIRRLRIGKKVSKWMQVCSKHFLEDDFFQGPGAGHSGQLRQRRRLIPRAVPSVNLPVSVAEGSECITKKSKTGERKRRHTEINRFPKDKEHKRLGVKAVQGKACDPIKDSRSCSTDFSKHVLIQPSLNCVKLCETAVPTISEEFPSYLQKKKRNRPSLDISLPSTSSAVESDNSIQESSEISIVDSYTIDETLERNAAEVKQESAAITDLPAENPPTAEMVNPNIEESLPSAENVKKEFKTAPVTSPSFQKCCVRNCNSRQWIGTKIIFHKFPLENEELTRKWVENIGQEDFIPTVNDTICSRHFVVKDYINRHVSEKTLKNDAIPRVFDSEMQVDGETDSEEMLSSDNESMDSEEVLKRKVKKWKASYKESQRKLKEYKKLCKLYVKEVFTLREVITNLQQINSVTDGDYFEVKS